MLFLWAACGSKLHPERQELIPCRSVKAGSYNNGTAGLSYETEEKDMEPDYLGLSAAAS